jgi:hypothetical protein
MHGDMVLGRHEDLQIALLHGVTSMFADERAAIERRFPGFNQQIDEAKRKLAVPFGYMLRDVGSLWPRRTIPYDIEPGVESLRPKIEAAIAAWNATGVVRFVPMQNAAPGQLDAGHVAFVKHPNGQCWSDSGRQSYGVWVQLGSSCTVGTIVHELGHSLGLAHEHLRAERSNFLKVNIDIVLEKYQPEINGCEGADGQANCAYWYVGNGDYDLCSIMHYEATLPAEWLVNPKANAIFSLTDAGKKALAQCMTQFQDSKCHLVGQDCAPSALDRAAISALYSHLPW